MEQRITLITLGVADLHRSRGFYERLGWKPHGDNAGVVFFQLHGAVLSLFGREDLAEDASVPAEGSGFRAVTLAYNVRSKAEVDAALREAEAAGARITRPADDAFWGGYRGYFADPDGHLWEVAWNPFLPLDPEGRATLAR